MNRTRSMLLKVVAASLFTGVGGLSFVYSGFYNVGATDGHSRVVEWALRMAMENSVRYHAGEIVVPAGVDLNSRELAEKAIGHYSVACATCHSAPGRSADPWMKIYPEAPDLTKHSSVEIWSDAEFYWIIKHGIKDTGMLALGPTHTGGSPGRTGRHSSPPGHPACDVMVPVTIEELKDGN